MKTLTVRLQPGEYARLVETAQGVPLSRFLVMKTLGVVCPAGREAKSSTGPEPQAGHEVQELQARHEVQEPQVELDRRVTELEEQIELLRGEVRTLIVAKAPVAVPATRQGEWKPPGPKRGSARGQADGCKRCGGGWCVPEVCACGCHRK